MVSGAHTRITFFHDFVYRVGKFTVECCQWMRSVDFSSTMPRLLLQPWAERMSVATI